MPPLNLFCALANIDLGKPRHSFLVDAAALSKWYRLRINNAYVLLASYLVAEALKSRPERPQFLFQAGNCSRLHVCNLLCHYNLPILRRANDLADRLRHGQNAINISESRCRQKRSEERLMQCTLQLF
jgi:hypothetical protein